MLRQRWNNSSHDNQMQLTSSQGIQDMALMGGTGYPLGIVNEIKILQYYQMVYAQNKIRPGIWGV